MDAIRREAEATLQSVVRSVADYDGAPFIQPGTAPPMILSRIYARHVAYLLARIAELEEQASEAEEESPMIPDNSIYEAAMDVVGWLMKGDPEPGTPRAIALDYISEQTEAYERSTYPEMFERN